MTALHRDDHFEPSPMSPQAGQTPADIAALTGELAGLRTHLQSVREVSGRPDWTILLAALSQTLGDDVVLNAVDCTDGGSGLGKSAISDAAFPTAFKLTGMGKTQNSVTRFVVAVENLQFFGQVQLVQTAPQSLGGRECVGFGIVCTLASNMKGAK